MPDSQPNWLTEECPAWCAGEHADQDHPSDRQHQSEQDWQPAIMLNRRLARDPAGAVRRDVEAAEFCVVAFRYAGDWQTWVAVANDDQRIEVTRESAHRLHAALGRLLDLLGLADPAA